MDRQHGGFGVLLIVISLLMNLGQPLSFSANFIILCSTAFLVWALWTTFVYPFFLSPLRHLPMPKENHWLWGHGMKLFREPQGNPSKQW